MPRGDDEPESGGRTLGTRGADALVVLGRGGDQSNSYHLEIPRGWAAVRPRLAAGAAIAGWGAANTSSRDAFEGGGGGCFCCCHRCRETPHASVVVEP